MATHLFNTSQHPITDGSYIAACRVRLEDAGALVLRGFATADAIGEIVAESAFREATAYYTDRTHNVYLTTPDRRFADDHPHNRQIVSSKGLIADDEIPLDSPLREIYGDESFRAFLCGVLGLDQIHPYDDDLSSINVHYAAAGMELGWHFDNSSFAVTMLLQAADGGAQFQYVPDVRNAEAGDMGYDRVAQILAGGERAVPLDFEPGDLVLFRGRNAMHRVTPTVGHTTRLLVVFAYNDGPGIALSESALTTFYGRTTRRFR